MAISKVVYGNDTLIDITDSTVDASNMLNGTVGYSSAGDRVVGNVTIPTVNNSTVTIQKNGTNVDSFTLNQSTDKTINITMAKGDVGLSNVPNVTTNNQTPTFSEATTRANIASGEKLSVIFGKIMKWFTDLKDLAFIAKDGNTTTYLRGDGTWQAFPSIPTVNNATLTIQKNGTTVKTFTANASSNVTCNITVPTKTSDITNDSNFVASSDLATVATSGSYNDLSNKPTIPTVNNATLTIQKNGTNVQTFTANASANKTANITVPTAVSELTNDSGYLSGTVPIENGGTNATTRLGALKNLTNQSVSTAATFFLTITNSWGKGGYTSVADAKTVLGLKDLAYIAKDGDSSTKYLRGDGQWIAFPTIPTVNNATLTIQKNGTTVKTFTANASSNVTCNITVPTKTSDITNDSNFVASSDLATVATSGSYNDLSNKPTIPTVNNATLTIQKNGTTVKTFTANASSNVTCNITVPTALSDLTDDATHRIVTDTEKSTWNAKASTSTATSSANGLMSSTDKSKLDGIRVRSCIVGQSGNTTSNPWFKFATLTASSANGDWIATFLVEDTYGAVTGNTVYSTNCAGIFRVRIRTGKNSNNKAIPQYCEMKFIAETGYVIDSTNTDDFLIVHQPADTENPIYELWTRIAYGYKGRRFTILDEGNRSNVYGSTFTLVGTGLGTGQSKVTEGYTRVYAISALNEILKWKDGGVASYGMDTSFSATGVREILIKGEISSSQYGPFFVEILILPEMLTTSGSNFRGGWHQASSSGGAIYFNVSKTSNGQINVSLLFGYLNNQDVSSYCAGTVYYR